MRIVSAVLAAAALLACGGSPSSSSSTPPPGDAPGATSPTGTTGPTGPTGSTGPAPGAPGWVVAAAERFDGALPAATFAADTFPDDGPFSDAGAFFTRRGVTPPAAFRASVPFGANGWLTGELYTRRAGASRADQLEIVADPADASNHVLRVRSPEHTDAAVVHPTAPLPARYRVSLRVGWAEFGDGKPGPNGYDGGETAGPWWPTDDATRQNGFYWLTILDGRPLPHNNTSIHHHRKVVIDSDNHYPAWMEIWDGNRFLSSGEHPVMMFGLDGSEPGTERDGPPFFAWSHGAWQPSGSIRAVDAYLPNTWYQVTIERDGPRYTLTVAGKFRYGGDSTYTATIDAAAKCLFHYPVDAAEAAGAKGCEDPGSFASTGGEFPRWAADGAWPDWFMFGDPHANYYEGEILYDDVVLETWRE
jgi:hypothetical protein